MIPLVIIYILFHFSRSELEDYAEQQEMMTQIKREKMQKQRLDEFTKKNHFLVSTEVIPGVYNNPYKP